MKAIRIIITATSLMTALTGGLAASEFRDVDVQSASEVEFETQRGYYYQVQASTNNSTWDDIGVRIYGHGHREQQIFVGGGAVAFRVALTDAPTNGFAPASFEGLTFNLDDLPGGDLMQFTTATNGTDLGVNPDPFTYALTALNADQVQADVNYVGGKRDLYTFTFTIASGGSWSRDEFRNGLFKDRNAGTFRVSAGLASLPAAPADATNAVPVTTPTALARFTYVFTSGESPDVLQFITTTNGLADEDKLNLTDNSPNKPFTYSYTLVKSNAATLIVTWSTIRRDEYALSFTAAAQGSFIRREFRNNVLDDIDNGTFSPTAVAITNFPAVNSPITNGATTASPSSIFGQVFTFRESGSASLPVVTSFLTSSSGSQSDDSGPSSFNYTWIKTGTTTATLTVLFKPGKWDSYDINFTTANTGAFTRREYRNYIISDIDIGTFNR